jgi:hypothetical protein
MLEIWENYFFLARSTTNKVITFLLKRPKVHIISRKLHIFLHHVEVSNDKKSGVQQNLAVEKSNVYPWSSTYGRELDMARYGK